MKNIGIIISVIITINTFQVRSQLGSSKPCIKDPSFGQAIYCREPEEPAALAHIEEPGILKTYVWIYMKFSLKSSSKSPLQMW